MLPAAPTQLWVPLGKTLLSQRGGWASRSLRGPGFPSRPPLEGWGKGAVLRPRDLEGPGPAWGHLGILGERGSPFGLGPLAIAASLGTAPATPVLRGSGTWPRPFSNRLARKLCACLVSWAAGKAVCGRAWSGGDCGAATEGRCSTRVPAGPPGSRVPQL